MIRGLIALFFMIGNLEPEEKIMTQPTIMEQVATIAQKYGWQDGDNISVEMAGTQVSGIDVGEEYNEKWQSPIGTRKCNKDAFIVIKNLDRSPFEPSKPNLELKQAHPYEKK